MYDGHRTVSHDEPSFSKFLPPTNEPQDHPANKIQKKSYWKWFVASLDLACTQLMTINSSDY